MGRDVIRHVAAFLAGAAERRLALYNECSLQHELGLYLRSALPPGWAVEFERPAGHFIPGVPRLTKKEIDLTVTAPGPGARVAIELKCPRAGQHPEQMFKACQDVAFLEELVAHGFSAGIFVMHVRDPLFYVGPDRGGIYAHFRDGRPLAGTIVKPTGRRDQTVTLSGTYRVEWQHIAADDFRYALVAVGLDEAAPAEEWDALRARFPGGHLHPHDWQQETVAGVDMAGVDGLVSGCLNVFVGHGRLMPDDYAVLQRLVTHAEAARAALARDRRRAELLCEVGALILRGTDRARARGPGGRSPLPRRAGAEVGGGAE